MWKLRIVVSVASAAQSSVDAQNTRSYTSTSHASSLHGAELSVGTPSFWSNYGKFMSIEWEIQVGLEKGMRKLCNFSKEETPHDAGAVASFGVTELTILRLFNCLLPIECIWSVKKQRGYQVRTVKTWGEKVVANYTLVS